MSDGYCEGCDNPGCRHGGCQGRKPELSDRSKMYASGNRKAENLAPKEPDPRPRSRLYGRMK